MLKVVLGESVVEEPVELMLTERRPHVRWAGEMGSGKTVQMRMVARDLMDQIPHTKGRLRLVLFDMLESAELVPDVLKACPELDELPGVLVVRAGQDVTAAVQRVREELRARSDLERAGCSVEALVIAVDHHYGLEAISGELRQLVEDIGNGPAATSRDYVHRVHLLLTSDRLRDYTSDAVRRQFDTIDEERRARQGWIGAAGAARRPRVRGLNGRLFGHDDNLLTTTDRFSTITFALDKADLDRYFPGLAVLPPLPRAVWFPPRHTDSFGYLITPGAVTLFKVRNVPVAGAVSKTRTA
ncbi:Uncharacterised protein [Mycobacteroides abscessus subsp. massiliense]|uniref:hypothetical protein n=1 Tax=Mycobacteroides abscessus TaxID=36809 RepID=UPI0009A733C7|nr:hypothetical protein [Mycobacteroides abscessus]MBE5502639.1 hypothetical protein [Mycobacteroides abscessus]SLH53083.1 Uncharacterised protein [Mycobacteroides abscessus subsp. massiliense]